jgi:hypothetical protein
MGRRRWKHFLGFLPALAVFLGVACGNDMHGTGPLRGGDSGLDEGGGAASSSGAGGTDSGITADSSADNWVSSTTGTDGSGPGTVNTDSGGAGMAGADGAVGTMPTSTDAATSDGPGALYAPCSADGGSCPQGLQCDPTLGCVACAMDSQCPASMRFCLLGNCVQCKSNTDCGGTTPSCWPANHSCHAACSSTQPCSQDSSARICNPTTGACVGCITGGDCPTSQAICDPTSQQCVQCVSRADCAGTSTPACVQNRCVPCATGADCSGATPFCASGGDSPWRCVQCIQNAQCPPSAPSCNGGTCGKSGG